MRILIVDDDNDVSLTLSRLLSRIMTDAEIEVLNNPQVAQQLIDEEAPYDLIITDREMQGIKGEELIAQAQKKSAATKCLMITGTTSFCGNGSYPILYKPVGIRKILDTIK